ncbi:MAG: phosphoribosylglycinamide formyltransferase [Planctomycetota bacterium]|nr:phosphoribosylglycinamide formyltransferase [Planctomycetota bacterium]MDG1983536.1 phosphoribosylglycinamide formyltransferase [Planctomycetota bacterium]
MTHSLAVLVSGTGRHLENLADLALDEQADFDAEVSVVLSNRTGVAALDRAARFGLRAEVLEGAEGESVESYGRRVFDVVRDAGADTVVLAGFLKKLWIPADFAGRVINIHPSLLPAFGGKGYFGMNVHRAVLERGCQVSGCTVHLVDEVYDNGPILLQRWCAVEPEDSAEDLAARVFQEELLALPEALRRFWRR